MSSAHLWTTAAVGDAADTQPGELAALQQHVAHCSAASARMAALHCGALRMRGFMLSRLVTTLAVVAALGALLLFGL